MSHGNKLISQIALNTGLPNEIMTDELSRLLGAAGLEPEMVTLDDLRKVLADYAQEVLLAAKEEFDQEDFK